MLSHSHPQPDDTVVAIRPKPAAAPSAPVRGPIRLPRSRRLAVYVIAGLTWATGALYLVFHEFLQTPGEFGPEANPLEPWWLKSHGAAAFAALWIFGLLWGVHALNGWNARRRRWSGGLLFGAVAVLIGSGFLLYYAGDEGMREVVSVLHWVLGLAAPLAFMWHWRFSKDR